MDFKTIAMEGLSAWDFEKWDWVSVGTLVVVVVLIGVVLHTIFKKKG